jgi:hypothetical protein
MGILPTSPVAEAVYRLRHKKLDGCCFLTVRFDANMVWPHEGRNIIDAPLFNCIDVMRDIRNEWFYRPEIVVERTLYTINGFVDRALSRP